MWMELNKKHCFKKKTKIIPVDSEHFSIMKLLKNISLKNKKNLYNCFWWAIFKL